MIQDDTNDSLTQKITQSLNQQVEALDAATLSRLQQARTHALEQKRTQEFTQPQMMWAGGLVTFTTLSIILILMWPKPHELAPTLTPDITDIALLIDDESIDFYEDLDFYIWLEQKELDTSDA